MSRVMLTALCIFSSLLKCQTFVTSGPHLHHTGFSSKTSSGTSTRAARKQEHFNVNLYHRSSSERRDHHVVPRGFTLPAVADSTSDDSGTPRSKVMDSGITRLGLLGVGVENFAAVATATAVLGVSVVGTTVEAVDETREPAITTKCFIEVRIMEPLNAANGYSSANAYKGKLVFGLYGKACPKATENFLRYVTADRTKDEPSYAAGLMTKMEPGVFLEGGRIRGLNSISIGGQEQLEFDGDVIESPSLLETTVELRHTKRGLLTRPKLARGPEFAVTLGQAPDLDGSHEVFGKLIQGEDVLQRLERVPVYSGASRLEPGSAMDKAFRAQNRALVYIGKNVFKDERAVDRTGLFMRRIDILSCGLV